MRQKPKSYLRISVAAAGFVLVLIGSFNLCVDPYGAYRLFDGKRVQHHPAVYHRVKLAKAYDLRRIAPLAIALGTSRTHIGIRMSHEGWAGSLSERYNSAFDGATTKEMYFYLLHAYAIRPLQQVVLGLDLWHLPKNPAFTRADFDQGLFFVPGNALHAAGVYAADAKLLISIDTTMASIHEMSEPLTDAPQWLAPDGQRIGDVFFHDVDPEYSPAPGRYFRSIDQIEIAAMLDDGPAKRKQKLTPEQESSPETSFDYIAKIVAFCRAHKVDLRIFITPSHVHELVIARQLGNERLFESGKRDLAMLLSRDAEQSGARPFPLYDFGGPSSITTERVPADQSSAEMIYYWDPSHFKEIVGDWILDRLFGITSAASPAPRDFGKLLTPGTIDRALEDDRSLQDLYEREHADDVSAITSAISRVRSR